MRGGYKSFLKININTSLKRIGTGYGSYTLADNLQEAPVVFSFGVGEDIQFEKGIIENYPAAKVFAFDPTPKSIDFINKENNDKIHFYPIGLSDKNETEIFYMPVNEDFVSCSVIKHEGVGRKEISVEMRTLKSLMELCNVDHIDILKMDIEGSEFKVIPDILSCGIKCKQLLVELHERFLEQPKKAFYDIMNTITSAGYELAYVSGSAEEFSFIRS